MDKANINMQSDLNNRNSPTNLFNQVVGSYPKQSKIMQMNSPSNRNDVNMRNLRN